MSKLKTDSQENNMKTRENFEKLKRNLLESEKVNDKKNNRILVNIQKQRALLSSVQKAIESSNPSLYGRVIQSFE